MVLLEMLLEGVVVDKILVLATVASSVTNVASLVPVPAMDIQFIIAIKPLAAKTTLGMAPETSLLDSARVVISVFFMPTELRNSKQVMLVGEDLLVARAKITEKSDLRRYKKENCHPPHHLLVLALDVPMEIGPA